MANEIAEFARNYEHCFFRVQLKNSKQYRAFMLTHWDSASSYYGKILTRTLVDKGTFFEAAPFLQNCEPMIGVTGYINAVLDRPVALYLQVNPDRQYRKSLSMDGTSNVSCPSTGSLQLSDFVAIECDKKGLTSQNYLFRAYLHQLALDGYPIFKGIRTAVGLVEDGTAHSVAISKFFAVSLHRGLRYPVIWYKNKKEGVIVNDVCYGTDTIMPFKEFFAKRFDFPMLSYRNAPVRD